MHRNRKAFSQMAKLGDGASARAHVILGMHFQPADRPRIGHDRCEMLRL